MATITSKSVEYLASLPKDQSRLALAKTLKWPPFDEDHDMQEAIKLDFLFDSMNYAVEKGFPWNKVAFVVKFADKLTEELQNCDKITDILGFYNSQSTDLIQTLGERDYKIYSSFVFETILPHFKLYKLVFTTPRAEQIPNLPIAVKPPFESGTLKETKPLKVWEYEKRIQDLEAKEEQKEKERLAENEKKLSELQKESKDALEKVVQVETPLNKEVVGSIIEEVMKQYTISATENLKFKVEKLRDDLEFKLEKTCMPRPQVLGPPPRYNVQAAKIPSSKMPKSPKPGSRASGRSKKK
ncbi:uncharacterized protein C8orf74 homolog isoform X2 [Ruditapes philippinarum]|uniref:uncharacterized protein C8orf74 homolog isoform X2 n=1 Tax=Ruditapes philippinarum TaxID=129788 RepID=UPI00295AA788|nr:uncharacterized protein C8orf74 homolog isoform X2 [Ruditapes philippinarum]